MSIADKIRGLCDFNSIPVSKLETILGFSNGSLTKNNSDAMRSDRIRSIAEYFDVTPTYLMSEMKYCVCPVCAIAFNPLDAEDKESHKILHKNYLKLRERIGYLLNPSQAATKRTIAKSYLEDHDLPDEGKVFHYETLVQCDFAEHAYFNNFIVNTSYLDFMKEEIRERKYFDLISPSVIKNLTVKYNVDLSTDDLPITELFKTDETFMEYVTDMWDLPQELRIDVYKAIRHAKRDYADKEYFTNPYANKQHLVEYAKRMKVIPNEEKN